MTVNVGTRAAGRSGDFCHGRGCAGVSAIFSRGTVVEGDIHLAVDMVGVVGDGPVAGDRSGVAFDAAVGVGLHMLGVGGAADRTHPVCGAVVVAVATVTVGVEGAAPGGGDVRRRVGGSGRGPLAVTIGVRTIAKEVVLAGQIVVELAGIGTITVVGSRSEADVQDAISCAGGVCKCGVIGVTFIAVVTAMVILVVFGVASRCSTVVARRCT